MIIYNITGVDMTGFPKHDVFYISVVQVQFLALIMIQKLHVLLLLTTQQPIL